MKNPWIKKIEAKKVEYLPMKIIVNGLYLNTTGISAGSQWSFVKFMVCILPYPYRIFNLTPNDRRNATNMLQVLKLQMKPTDNFYFEYRTYPVSSHIIAVRGKKK